MNTALVLLGSSVLLPLAAAMVWLYRNRHDPEINYEVDFLGRRKERPNG